MSTSDPTTPPNLSAEQLAKLIECFGDPTLSLHTLAEQFQLSLEQLTLLIARPDVLARLTGIESTAALHTRFAAGLHLSTVIPNLCNTLKAAVAAEDANPTDYTNPVSVESVFRRHERARRAGSLLLRLARFSPGATVHRAARTPLTALSPTEPIVPVRVAAATSSSPPSSPRSSTRPLDHSTTQSLPLATRPPDHSITSASPSRAQLLQAALVRSNLPQPVS